MAPVRPSEDYYAVLEVSKTATTAAIRLNYMRLAKIRHPDKNTSLNATEEFQLLNQAYSTLIDPQSRASYDVVYETLRLFSQTKPQKTTAEAASQQAKYGQSTGFGSSNANSNQATHLQKTLEELLKEKTRLTNEAFETKRRINRLKSELQKLQDDANRIAREEAAEGSWGTWITSLMGNTNTVSSAKKLEQERQKIARMTAQRIKQEFISGQERDLNRTESDAALLDVRIYRIQAQIAAEKQNAERNKFWEDIKKQSEERAQQEQETRRAREEELERRRREEQERRHALEELLARQRKEEQERRRAREEEVQRRRKAEAEQRKKERAERERALCKHKTWWERVEGAQLCSNCLIMTRKFAYKCPRCDTIACANCRIEIKGRS